MKKLTCIDCGKEAIKTHFIRALCHDCLDKDPNVIAYNEYQESLKVKEEVKEEE